MLNLVICDDERTLRNDLRQVLETELELCGETFKIAEFDCGESLVRALNDSVFDIIFLDIEMKDLDGVATAREIRNAWAGILKNIIWWNPGDRPCAFP